MTDQPLDGDFGGTDETYETDPYLEASNPSESWTSSITRDASAALVLGILGFATCGLLSPLALYYGRRALNEMDATGLAYGASERNARVGQLLGIVGTTLLLVGTALVLIFGMRAWDFLSDLDLSDVNLSRNDSGG